MKENLRNYYVLLIAFMMMQLSVRAQPLYQNFSIFPCTGIRSTELVGMVEVADGYIAAGWIDTFYNGGYGTGRIWVTKLDVDGKILWSKFYRDEDPNLTMWTRRVTKADNGGVYLLVQKASVTGQIFKIDKNGDLVWKRAVAVMPNSVRSHDLITTPDEGCLAVGNTVNSDSGAMVRLHRDGTINFTTKILPQKVGKIELAGADVTSDGGFYVVGVQSEYDPYPVWKNHLLVMKLSANGGLEWYKTYFSGDELSGDKIRAFGYTISALNNGDFLAGGRLFKESILNGHALLLKGNATGDIQWMTYLHEDNYPYPVINPRNAIRKISVNRFNEDLVYVEFIEAEYSSSEKNYLEIINPKTGVVVKRQTGYKRSDQHTLDFRGLLASGQPYFTGGEYFLNLDRKGLILITTPDGVWVPPSIVSVEPATKRAWVVTTTHPHIETERILQLSLFDDFRIIALEQSGIQEDSTFFDMSLMNDGKYYLRVGIKGRIGSTVWSAPTEVILFTGLKLRYVHQVSRYSSQYGGNWSASQIIGAPDVYPSYGDLPGAWASGSPDGQREFLELKFLNPKPIKGVILFETFNPGAIDTVYVRDPVSQQWVVVWTGVANPQPPLAKAFSISFPTTTFDVSEVRIAINSPVVSGYNELDAVGLIDAETVKVGDGINIADLTCIIFRNESEIHFMFNRLLQGDALVEIYSINGTPLRSYKLYSNENQYSIQLPSSLPRGIFVKLNYAGKSIAKMVY